MTVREEEPVAVERREHARERGAGVDGVGRVPLTDHVPPPAYEVGRRNRHREPGLGEVALVLHHQRTSGQEGGDSRVVGAQVVTLELNGLL